MVRTLGTSSIFCLMQEIRFAFFSVFYCFSRSRFSANRSVSLLPAAARSSFIFYLTFTLKLAFIGNERSLSSCFENLRAVPLLADFTDLRLFDEWLVLQDFLNKLLLSRKRTCRFSEPTETTSADRSSLDDGGTDLSSFAAKFLS